MRSTHTLLRLAAAVALSACGEGELETITTIQGICTLESRLAVLVTVVNPDDLEIDAVTVEHVSEHNCFLETRPRGFTADDAGEANGTLYSCWEQGTGAYVVRVKSGKQTWTENVDVPGNECHVTKAQKLTIAID
jgi:hypothetical protein